jgi:hypothetical protein
MADSVEDIEKRRADRKAERERLRAEQYAKDVIDIEAAELEHGDDRIEILKMPSFVAGLPTVVVVKVPPPAVLKRYRQMVRRAGQNYTAIGEARDMMAAECIAFPDKETYAKMKDAWPLVHDDVALAATKLGEAEGKG